MLYIIATPIGHLGDISQRALEVLRCCDLILCEDTRHSAVLLNHYKIHSPLRSYHKFNEAQCLEQILEDLSLGKNLALISDAGTPCINDPGERLLAACIEKGLPFTALPGPCSPIQALLLSGFETQPFQCIGFLPKRGEKMLRQLLFYPGTTIAFESPARLLQTLEALAILSPERRVAVVREMTKTFEECRRGAPQQLIEHFKVHPPKGEIVLVIAPGKPPMESLEIEECVHLLSTLLGLSLKEAIKQAAHLLKLPKQDVYKKFHKNLPLEYPP
ncbi:MAG: 16S rRNA (cytidine(1402)-2'-O)-methyltransferase [Chlamydiia bacterium]|nr:16S rRNA (cytidine(1402)-2'-O)-methyltransferase [Chlamydiia bacterium]